MKKQFSFAVLIMCLCLCNFSCNKYNNTGICKKCNTEIDQNVTVNLFGKNYNALSCTKRAIQLKKYTSIKSIRSCINWDSLHVAYIDLDSADMISFINSLDSNISGDFNSDPTLPYTITFYIDSFSSNLSYSHIYGISKYNTDYSGSTLNGLDHKYYTVSNTSTSHNSSLDATCEEITGRGREILLANSLSGVSNIQSPYILEVSLNLSSVNSALASLPTNPLDKTIIGANFTIPNSSAGCASSRACAHGKGDCSREGCLGYVDQEEEQIATHFSYSGYLASTDSVYSFETNFLSSYELGQKYTNYYFEIGYINLLYTPYTRTNYMSFIQFYNECFNVAYTLQFGSDSDVVIDSTFYNHAKNFIRLYKTITSNDSYNAMLDDISNDLDTYVGMTKVDLLSTIY